jgi:hypothetical protein
MRMSLTAAALLALAPAAAIGQFDPGPDYSCTPPDPTGCMEWSLTERAHDLLIREDISEVQVTIKKSGWHWANACNCAYIPCDERHTCPPPEVDYQEQWQICWGITASVSAQASDGLLAELFVKLGITVSIGGNYNSCTTVTETLKYRVPVDDCWKNAARDITTINRVEGTRVYARNVYWWDCTDVAPPNYTHPVRTWCGEYQVNGWAKDVANREVQYADRPPCAGGPNPPRKELDGGIMEQCCHPMPPCDVVPPGSDPCCACWSPL